MVAPNKNAQGQCQQDGIDRKPLYDINPPCWLDVTTKHEMPKEAIILARILSFLRESTTAAGFVPYLTVCRGWYDIGSRIQLAVVVLTNSNLKTFLEQANQKMLGNFPTVSLTVSLQPVPTPRLNVNGNTSLRLAKPIVVTTLLLHHLSRVITRDMPFLNSFSLYVNDDILVSPAGSDEYMMSFPAAGIAVLLNSLPQSCRKLEIDTGGCEVYDMLEDHLCPAIARFISRVRYLRIRLGRLCPVFIGSRLQGSISRECVAPELRSLVVNFDIQGGIGGQTQTTHCFVDRNRPINLTHFLHMSYQAGTYIPCIRKLLIFSRTADQYQRSLNVIDIPNSKPNMFALRQFKYVDIGDLGFSAILSAVQLENDCTIIGSPSQVRDTLEGAWRFTTGGARFPSRAARMVKTIDKFGHYTLRVRVTWGDPPRLSTLPVCIVQPGAVLADTNAKFLVNDLPFVLVPSGAIC
ncbi:hypothetical protein FQN57_002067 [Myotisia sp. PD_48]|nr:hypothetical protein FQN57_002067 [Myotisia sp. PD_48]